MVGKEDIFVSTGVSGAGSDGTLPRRDMLDADGNISCKVGDKLDLFVTQVRGSQTFLSPKASAKNLADDIEDAFDRMLAVEGRVVEVCKGGVRVSLHGKIAFCPISQLDLARVETGEEFVGKKLEFRVTQFSEGGRNIVVSRRKLLEEQRGLSEGAFTGDRKIGDLVQGKVKRIEPFGAFVEVAPGVDGLVHVSELSWSRVGHPQEVVSVGQDVLVKILKTESIEGRLKISLSIKQVEEGITGLLPKSKANENPEFPFEKLKNGDSVTVQMGELRLEERRISLIVPQDPNRDDWKGFVGTSSSGFGTLGDVLKKSMEKKKK